MEDYTIITAVRYDPALLDVNSNTVVNGGIPDSLLFFPFHYDRISNALRVHRSGSSDEGNNITSEILRGCFQGVSFDRKVPHKVSDLYAFRRRTDPYARSVSQ